MVAPELNRGGLMEYIVTRVRISVDVVDCRIGIPKRVKVALRPFPTAMDRSSGEAKRCRTFTCEYNLSITTYPGNDGYSRYKHARLLRMALLQA
jgi:hypothetical protein